MEALPLELLHQIFTSILSHQSLTQVTVLPVSTLPERNAIYNIRLASRRIRTAASQSFVQIVQDVPTECKQQSLVHLAALLKLEDIGSKLTCLTLNTCKLFVTDPSQDAIDLRRTWLEGKLYKELVAIICSAPRIHSLACVVEATRGVPPPQVQQEDKLGPDPMRSLRRALKTTSLNATLTTLLLLCPSPYPPAPNPSLSSAVKSLTYPSLRHLTIAPSARFTSDCRVLAPVLTTLHLILDEHSLATDPAAPLYIPVPPTLRSCTITANPKASALIQTSALLDALAPVLQRAATLPLLTIRDVDLVIDISYEGPGVEGEGRIARLVFENVRYCFTDDMTLSGPSELRGLDGGWKPLEELVRRAGGLEVV